MYSVKFEFLKVLPELTNEFFTLPLQAKEQEILGKSFSEKLKQDRGGEDLCPICFMDYKKNEVVTKVPVCCHEFHFGCLKLWVNNHHVCPVCRGIVRKSMLQHYHGEFELPCADKKKENLNREQEQGDVEGNNENNNNGGREAEMNEMVSVGVSDRNVMSNNLRNFLMPRPGLRV